MDFGNPFITQAERTDIVVKLKRYLAAMLEDQAPANLLANAPRITEMATRFEESVWRATSSKEEYVRMIQARIQVVQQQRRSKESPLTNGAGPAANASNGNGSLAEQSPSSSGIGGASSDAERQQIVAKAMPQLDALIKANMHLKGQEVFTKILGVRTFSFKTLESVAKAGGVAGLGLANATALVTQTLNAIAILRNQKVPAVADSNSEEAKVMQEQPVSAKQDSIDPGALRLVCLLVQQEIDDFRADFPEHTLDIRLDTSSSLATVSIDGRAQITAGALYPTDPAQIDILDGHWLTTASRLPLGATVTNALRHFARHRQDDDDENKH